MAKREHTTTLRRGKACFVAGSVRAEKWRVKLRLASVTSRHLGDSRPVDFESFHFVRSSMRLMGRTNANMAALITTPDVATKANKVGRSNFS